jgi:hypothetical protein
MRSFIPSLLMINKYNHSFRNSQSLPISEQDQ